MKGLSCLLLQMVVSVIYSICSQRLCNYLHVLLSYNKLRNSITKFLMAFEITFNHIYNSRLWVCKTKTTVCNMLGVTWKLKRFTNINAIRLLEICNFFFLGNFVNCYKKTISPIKLTTELSLQLSGVLYFSPCPNE